MKDEDFHWLCGFLEGEGSFMKGPPSQPNYPIISVTSIDEDVIQKVSLLFGVKYCLANKRQQHWQQSYVIRIYGSKAVDLMTKMRPFMSRRRQKQIDTAILSYQQRPNRGPSKLTEDQVRQIKRMLIEKKSLREIAKLAGCSKWSVSRIKNQGAFPDIKI
jgi:hypothetical protein